MDNIILNIAVIVSNYAVKSILFAHDDWKTKIGEYVAMTNWHIAIEV